MDDHEPHGSPVLLRTRYYRYVAFSGSRHAMLFLYCTVHSIPYTLFRSRITHRNPRAAFLGRRSHRVPLERCGVVVVLCETVHSIHLPLLGKMTDMEGGERKVTVSYLPTNQPSR